MLGVEKIASAAESMTKEARELVYLFLKPSVREAGQTLADAVRIVRMKSVALVLARAKAKLEAAKLNINPPSPKILVQLLEECSLDEEDDMIERWANLLASAASADSIPPVFIQVLSGLSPEEVRILDSLKRLQRKLPGSGRMGTSTADFRLSLKLESDIFRRGILSLLRLGSVELFLDANFNFGGPSHYMTSVRENNFVGTSQFGDEFLAACTGPSKPSSEATGPVTTW